MLNTRKICAQKYCKTHSGYLQLFPIAIGPRFFNGDRIEGSLNCKHMTHTLCVRPHIGNSNFATALPHCVIDKKSEFLSTLMAYNLSCLVKTK